MDDASVYQLFAKRRLADTKLLLEGQGIAIENKFNTPFTGFVGCYTILTCNFLPYPFTLPVSSNSGFDMIEFQTEKRAMTGRCKITQLTKSYNNEVDKFPFSAVEFAHMLRYMSDNFENFQPYRPAYDSNELSAQKTH